MGLFDLFSGFNEMEKQLLETHTKLMVMNGAPLSEAKKQAKDMLKSAIAESKKDNTYYLPQNLGDIILGYVKNNDPIVSILVERMNRTLPKKRAEGVTDEDFRWWWNLHDLERRMMQKTDESARIGAFSYFLEQYSSLSNEEARSKATEETRKIFPFFGVYDENVPMKPEDRPLPFELKERVNNYLHKKSQENPETFKREIQQSSNFNALVRKEIKAGRL